MLFTQPLDTQTHGLTRTQKDQSPCITFLLAVSVDFQPQVQRVRINDFILVTNHGPIGPNVSKPLPLSQTLARPLYFSADAESALYWQPPDM